MLPKVRLIALAVLFIAEQAHSCSWATGYFHQVTRLRGAVVGMGNYWPLLGYKAYPSWLRHRVRRDDAILRLYEYSWPTDLRQRSALATVRAGKHGAFDFGTLREGHYTLVIDWAAKYSDQFDVEIKRLPAETSSVLIDVSPVDPDCTGGHEFISYSN